MKKVQILNFGRLPVGQFSLDLKKKSDLGYFYLFLQHIYRYNEKYIFLVESVLKINFFYLHVEYQDTTAVKIFQLLLFDV